MPSKYAQEVTKLLAHLDEEDNHQRRPEPRTEIPSPDIQSLPDEEEPEISYHIHHYPDALVILKESEAKPNEQVIDSILTAAPEATQSPQTPTPSASDKKSEPAAYLILSFSLLMLLSIIMLQIYILMNPPAATITILAKSQTVTVNGTLQLGRVIAPITLTQTQTAPATGKGHQDATRAHGTITFYNGQSTTQTIPASTLFTGADGIQIVTEGQATIPPAQVPQFGETTVSAHAISPGSAGNIPAGDINTTIAIAVFAKNTDAFTGGQDERDFTIVTKNDIASVSTTLKTTLAQSVTAALQAQVNPNEQFQSLPCTPTATADHRVGQEATEVKVTASETCSGIAYNSQQLESKVTQLLTAQAIQTLGTGYSELGNVQVTVTHAKVTRTTPTLTFSCQGVCVYTVTQKQHLKKLIAGKTKQDALRELMSLPGVERVSISWEGKSNLPTDTHNIHLVIFIM